MFFDRYDIACAWYVHLSESHGGQWSREYRRLSRMLSWFKPGAFGVRMSENAQRIYADLRLAKVSEDVRESIIDEMSGEDIEDVSEWIDIALQAHTGGAR